LLWIDLRDSFANMERSPVDSRSLRSVGYDPSTSELEIEFHTGRIYRFSGVPAGVYAWLLRSPAKGGWFNRMIRDRYPYREVDERPSVESDLLDDLRRSLESGRKPHCELEIARSKRDSRPDRKS
jgi:hypothetical protein